MRGQERFVVASSGRSQASASSQESDNFQLQPVSGPNEIDGRTDTKAPKTVQRTDGQRKVSHSNASNFVLMPARSPVSQSGGREDAAYCSS